jgi:hypothetical protein
MMGTMASLYAHSTALLPAALMLHTTASLFGKSTNATGCHLHNRMLLLQHNIDGSKMFLLAVHTP